jgi:hypothetical protein
LELDDEIRPAGTGFVQTSAAAGQCKITICHHTYSKKHPMVTIRISNKAWPATSPPLRHAEGLSGTGQAPKHGGGTGQPSQRDDRHLLPERRPRPPLVVRLVLAG